MKQLKRLFCLSTVLSTLLICGSVQIMAQAERPRLVRQSTSRPVNAPAPAPAETSTSNRNSNYRPPLVSKIVLAQPATQPAAQPGIPPAKGNTNPAKDIVKTNNSYPMTPTLLAFNSKLMSGIQSRLGIRYVYGTEGPNTYDCSGFVWSVFQEAGIAFDRTSAHNYWNTFEPVDGDDRYKFGTLVFLNRLGHMGIVADEKGFYHASSSKGITYSPFEGYWEKRIVGFRRVPLNYGK